MLCNKRSHRSEKPAHHNYRKACAETEEPAQPKNKQIKLFFKNTEAVIDCAYRLKIDNIVTCTFWKEPWFFIFSLLVQASILGFWNWAHSCRKKALKRKQGIWSDNTATQMLFIPFFTNLLFKWCKFWDFPVSPVVKTLHSQCRGHGFDPWN